MSTDVDELPKSPLFVAIDKNETAVALEILKNREHAMEKDPSGMSVLSAAAYRCVLLRFEDFDRFPHIL